MRLAELIKKEEAAGHFGGEAINDLGEQPNIYTKRPKKQNFGSKN